MTVSPTARPGADFGAKLFGQSMHGVWDTAVAQVVGGVGREELGPDEAELPSGRLKPAGFVSAPKARPFCVCCSAAGRAFLF